MSKLPLRVATGTPSRIETADGWHFGIEWKDTSAANPYGEAEAFAAFIVRAVNSHETLISALTWAMSQIRPYSKRIAGQNEGWCDSYDQALAALRAAEKEEAA